MKADVKKKTPPEPLIKAANEDEKKKALEIAIKNIEKQFGAGAIMRLGDNAKIKIDAIPTGSLTLDIALGVGGVPRGRVVEIFGHESSGKTTIALHIAAQTQKIGGTVAFIDVEHALDPTYAAAIGININELFISQPNNGEQALEIAEALARSGAVDTIVIDSVAAMVTNAEIKGGMGDAHVGQLARLMSQALRKLTSVIAKSNCVCVFINQIREKIGSYMGGTTTPGGRALKFYASVRLEVRKSDFIKDGTNIVGTSTKCKVAKNKVAPPFKECQFDIMYGEGISRTGEVLDLAVQLEVIKKSGSWFSFNGEKLGQGRDNVKKVLKERPELMTELEKILMENASKLSTLKTAAATGTVSESKTDSEDETPETEVSVDIADIDGDFEEFTPAN
ncbi:MAG: recombinase RecA [Oscillospiraceae bacterium]|jgi:recombination protein RecA|nr:recombinase RecA [Oscillospiraceae bacterium]